VQPRQHASIFRKQLIRSKNNNERTHVVVKSLFVVNARGAPEVAEFRTQMNLSHTTSKHKERRGYAWGQMRAKLCLAVLGIVNAQG
jgi:hypothetical protein